MKNKIIKVLSQVSRIENPEVDFSASDQFGDYSSNICLRNKDLDPHKIADEINQKDLPFSAKVVGRFINFWIKNDVLVDNLIHIDDDFGRSNVGVDKTVIIDYSSPNIAKPFGIGHLRSTIIGQALYNIYKYLGYEVVGDNHLGDWGTQFGKLLYMIDIKNTDDYTIENLEKMYVEFHNLTKEDTTLEEKARGWFKKLEDGDSKARNIWQKCIDVSMKEFNKIYDLLGVKIDFAFGESYYESEMKQMLGDSNLTKLLDTGEDGAKIINLYEFGIKTPLMFLKSDGATTYATRDLATIKFRGRKWNPDVLIYEVGAEQKLHFEQVFASAKLLNLVKKDSIFVHTAHGLYLAPDGKKFSTRKGKTIKLEEVLIEAIDRATELGNSGDVAKKVGIGAIKYFDLMHSVQSNVVFDWEKILNMEGNSGPYLQYTVARCNSILAKLPITNFQFSNKYQLNTEETVILRSLVKFTEVIENAAINYSPNILCSYLYDLAQKFNTFYNKHKIIGSTEENFRLKLTQSVAQVLKTGLKLLGIEAPEKM